MTVVCVCVCVCGATARRVGRSLESANLRKEVCLSAVEKYVKSQAMCHHRFFEGNEGEGIREETEVLPVKTIEGTDIKIR